MFFIALFTLEMLLKMYSLGFQVIKNTVNIINNIRNNFLINFRGTLFRYLIVLIVLL